MDSVNAGMSAMIFVIGGSAAIIVLGIIGWFWMRSTGQEQGH